MRTVIKLALALATISTVSACATKPAPVAEAPPAPVAATPPPRPVGPVPGSAEDFRVSVGDRVFFDYDQYALRGDARATLDKQAAWLKRYGAVRVLVDGNADERGTREYNLALGERRANAARQYLIAQGIPAARLKTISYGKERPDPVGSDEAAWARNRRAVTELQ